MKHFDLAFADFMFWSVVIGFFIALTIVGIVGNYSYWFINTCIFESIFSIFAARYNYKRLIRCLKIS